jgi:hypothetical protein
MFFFWSYWQVISNISASRVKSLMTHRWARSNAPCLYDIFLHPISSIEIHLSYGILVSVHGYEATGPRFDPRSKHCYEVFICKVQFQFRNWCLSGFEPENSRMVSELANQLIFKDDFIEVWFQTYLHLASRRSWRTGERDATHRVSTTYFYIQFPLLKFIS